MPSPRGPEPGERKSKGPKADIRNEEPAVADHASVQPRPFDLATIRALVALMSRHDLSEIDLCEGDRRIQLRRGARTVSMPTAPPLPPSTSPTSSPAPEVAGPAAEPAKPAKPLLEIKSQLVGTFYVAPKPGLPPYVKVGDRVTPTTVVGIIEAMKINNEITADCAGVLVEICVENQQPVEFQQVLFRVDPSV
jgi:acetyl-CoA carboxylase biotin carboxyl carrier protein